MVKDYSIFGGITLMIQPEAAKRFLVRSGSHCCSQFDLRF